MDSHAWIVLEQDIITIRCRDWSPAVMHTDRRWGPSHSIVHSLTTVLSYILRWLKSERTEGLQWQHTMLNVKYAKYFPHTPIWTQQMKWAKLTISIFSCYLCLGLFCLAIVCGCGWDLCSVKAGGKSCIIPSSVQWNGTKLRGGIMATRASGLIIPGLLLFPSPLPMLPVVLVRFYINHLVRHTSCPRKNRHREAV